MQEHGLKVPLILSYPFRYLIVGSENEYEACATWPDTPGPNSQQKCKVFLNTKIAKIILEVLARTFLLTCLSRTNLGWDWCRLAGMQPMHL